MWVAVVEAARVAAEPRRALYWGIPIVVFRTASGAIGALEDICAHRGAPLSTGTVVGETVRCAYHHFAYDASGRCVSVPEAFGVDEQFRWRCSVRRFFVREALGLVWVSIEDEEAAPFPIDVGAVPTNPVLACGSFEVRGDLRVWMDHFLDATHCLWTHAETAYGGTEDDPAEPESIVVGISPESRYPARGAAKMTYRIRSDAARRRLGYSPELTLLSGIAWLRRWASLGSGQPAGPQRLNISADLLTPLCQYTWSHYDTGRGSVRFEGVAAINPLGPDRHEMFFSVFFQKPARGAVARGLQASYLRRFVTRHLGVEDNALLATRRIGGRASCARPRSMRRCSRCVRCSPATWPRRGTCTRLGRCCTGSITGPTPTRRRAPRPRNEATDQEGTWRSTR